MAEPVLRITHGDHSFSFRGLTAKEMAKVKTETGLANKQAFFDAIIDDDPDALIAAFVLARTRAGEKVRWDDVDINLDDVQAAYYDETDREVEPVFETDDNDRILLVKRDEAGRPVKDNGKWVTATDGEPVGKRDKQGRLIWRYVDTGEEVPPTDSAETIPSPDTKPTSGDSSESIPSLSIA